MRFSNPGAFFLLILLALFIVVAIYSFHKKNRILGLFISRAAFDRLAVRSGKEIDFFKTALLTGAFLFFILALAGPEWGEKFENVDIKGIEMAFLLDTSNSMSAEDLKPNRLEVAKQLILATVDQLQTDYIGLINFSGAAYIQCPLTVDYDAFKLMTDASIISPSEEQGTDFREAFQLSITTYKSSPNDRKLIILITDGEDQEKKWHEFLPELKKKGIIVFTVGIGIHGGAPIPIKDANGNLTGWKKDKEGNIVKTQLDENTLIQIASQTGGQYFRLTSVTAIDTFVHNLKAFDRKILRNTVQLSKIKRFQIPLIIGILFLLLELLLSEKKLSWKEKKQSEQEN